ncbi:beta strand repeat-containing protein [Deinococcus yavapaiensis]|uniref:beta strand repeat-containing protein n=1 Tax=Deinococcus yavapaiensis TaxID=309889 RepID=UPI0011B6BE82|nr:hypothetical protein [Deinococcus yavapaiensis]
MLTRNTFRDLRRAVGLSLVTLALAACGPGVTTPPPPTFTGVTSSNDAGAGSLRDTIANAKDGDVLRFTSSGTVDLQTSVVVTKDVTIEVQEGANVTLRHTNGPVLDVREGAVVTLRGLTLDGGGSATPLQTPPYRLGGLIVNAGTLTIESGTTLTGGRANGGGAIYNKAGATLTLRGGTIKNNTASNLGSGSDLGDGDGGAIFNEGTFTMTGGEISGNESFATGAVINEGTFTLSGGVIENNRCTRPNDDTARGCGGGGVFNEGTFVMEGGTIRGNRSTQFGAGVANYGPNPPPSFTLRGGTIENNAIDPLPSTGTRAPRDPFGGGVASGGVLVMENGTVRGNSAAQGRGGGLAVEGASAEIRGGVIENNTAAAAGGIFFVDAEARAGVRTISGGTIRGNVVTGRPANGTLSLLTPNGAGIAIFQANVTMSGGTIENNTGAINGGGVRVFSPSTFTLSGGTIRGHTAERGAGVQSDGTFTMTGGRIENNTASVTGGGVANAGTFALQNGTITGNTVGAAQGNEGAGGVRTYAGTTFTMSGGTISNNTARRGGGVVGDGPFQTSTAAQVKITGGAITGNTATVNGGGVNAFNLDLTGGTISNNTARDAGGVDITGASQAQNIASFSFSGGTISGNTARFGGGVRLIDATATMSGTAVVSGNRTVAPSGETGAAGGFQVNNSTFTLAGGTIESNASDFGGGLDVFGAAPFTMTGGTIRGNTTTRNGAGISLGTTGVVRLSGGTIENNAASDVGGGFIAYASDGRTINITLSDTLAIKNNTSRFCGAGAHANAAQTGAVNITMTGGTISGNGSQETGGGMCFLTNARLALSGGSITGNTAATNGGGLFFGNGSRFNRTGGTVSGNTPNDVFPGP